MTFDLPAATPGTVHLVGSGPGDPGLLTLRAVRLLQTCDLVAYDRLAPPEALALVPPGAERIAVGKADPAQPCRQDRPGETRGRDGWAQDEISTLLVLAAREGRAVVRLKGGDPFVFGRGGEEAIRCHEAGVPVEVVAGVTSAVAAPGAAGIPVTHRGVAPAVAFVTGHEDPTKPESQLDWPALAAFPGTLVFLMGMRSLPVICRNLRRHGRRGDTPLAVVCWGTTDRQRELVSDLAHATDAVAAAGIGSPATIVVGDVVALRERLGRRAAVAPAATFVAN
ncbi:MAG TPA: uroporphyrinogen-III C-methyltransferase [Egicoccus sp.]|nr:uroporphyrinogen-III C-methyltransferase [Egicoccus sp.]HSK22844.1 uroporphyrinogen-III C-methyltransferase [Egicoccus sp.]